MTEYSKNNSDYKKYYKDMLEAALEYQDFVVDQLRKHEPSFIINMYSSRKYQIEKGESANGIEIKYDKRMKETGNMYIETAEKSHPDNPVKVPSGIYRNDNTIFWLIGDYEQAFLFSKKQLQKLYENTSEYWRKTLKRRTTRTSEGFTLPVNVAMNSPLCLYRFDFTTGEKA